MTRPSRPVPPSDPLDATRAAYALALRWLSIREFAAARVRSKLGEKGFDSAVVESVIERLTANRAINDDRAVRACARTLVTVKRRGRQRVQRELEAMGFAAELARRTLADILGDADERAMASRVLVSRLRGARTITEASMYRRLFGALVRRGFSPAVVRDTLKPFWRRSAATPEIDGD